MKRAVLLTLALALVASSAAAQSRVADIYAEMARNAARAAQERAAIYAKMVADLAAATAAAIPPRAPAPVFVPYVPAAPVVTESDDALFARLFNEAKAEKAAKAASASDAPVPVIKTHQQYYEEALAYYQEHAARVAPVVDLAHGMVEFAPVGSCGIVPIKPIPPVGCRDLVPQCVTDGHDNSHWQWVCVK